MINLSQIKYVIAVASGKGGVGKSTLAVNLALALSMENQQTGILDADIYGPSIPLMLGFNAAEMPQKDHHNFIIPLVKHHLQTVSIGYFLDAEQPAIWRGPMVSKYLEELAGSTQWENLDYLMIDLPPGTGDIQLTLAQKIRTTGAVIITTPQDIALIDARKAIKMFEKVNIPLLGIVENMSTHICTQCGHEEDIFGTLGAEKLTEKFGIELLGKIPLDKSIRENTDRGEPTVIAAPESKMALIYRNIARRLIEKINHQERLKSKLPKFKISKT